MRCYGKPGRQKETGSGETEGRHLIEAVLMTLNCQVAASVPELREIAGLWRLAPLATGLEHQALVLELAQIDAEAAVLEGALD